MTYGLSNSEGVFLGVFRSCPLPAEDNLELLAQGRYLENAAQKRKYNSLPYRPVKCLSPEENSRRFEEFKSKGN